MQQTIWVCRMTLKSDTAEYSSGYNQEVVLTVFLHVISFGFNAPVNSTGIFAITVIKFRNI